MGAGPLEMRRMSLFILLGVLMVGFIVFMYRTYSDFHYDHWYESRIKAMICETVHESAIKGMECY